MKTKKGLTYVEKGTGEFIKGKEVMHVDVYTKEEIKAINQRKIDVIKQIASAVIIILYIAFVVYCLTNL